MILEKIERSSGFVAECSCDICGKKFIDYWSNILNKKHQFCGRTCYGEWEQLNRVGKKSSNWRGGKTLDSGGYNMIYLLSHPHKSTRGYVYKHRVVMEEFLGRYLAPEEVVHHINSMVNDNRIENLMLFANQSEHNKYHARLSKQKTA